MLQLRWLAGHFEEVLGAFLLAAMACLAFANVVTRYVFQLPLAFTEELEVNSLVWLTLLGTSAAFRRGRHLRMKFLHDKFPAAFRRWLDVLIALLSAGLFAILGVLGYQQILEERFLEITSESLNLPQWVYTICIPVGCALIVVRILTGLLADWEGRR